MNKSAEILKGILTILTWILSLSLIVTFFILVAEDTGTAFILLFAGAIVITLQYLLLDALCVGLIALSKTQEATQKLVDHFVPQESVAENLTEPDPTVAVHTPCYKESSTVAIPTADQYTKKLDKLLETGKIEMEFFCTTMARLDQLRTALHTGDISQQTYDQQASVLFATITE